ncbi:protein adenylyltransferase SelO [Salinimonas chungwhensis]|uniref:protein adenylyltransferase SelO n=1 Tax=Salinimonas chungwhensis TaxID=265425 RepID=UPI00038117B7|nr:protein adenylyltransferase SelO family protein [Salinimonas chungwhensis]
MTTNDSTSSSNPITSLAELAGFASYSLLDSLTADPDASDTADDYHPRQVFSGHYVPVKPTPIANPQYVAHSKTLFEELHFASEFARSDDFIQFFSGNMARAVPPMREAGWATGYALSIYGTEFVQQCPFQTGNGYGDGRAISVLEAVINGKRWEMQLKGAGRTPYCRGADGRAVLRSSVREFLVQDHMHALGVPSTRSLSLIVSQTETVDRPWYREGSQAQNPEIMVSNPVAITTRVAPSFLRVGQLELFARRTRNKQYSEAHSELRQIVRHLIEREYSDDVDLSSTWEEQLLQLAVAFRERLTSLIADWIRVGYCQGNFNSDNCAGGGFTLDYGPFGFCELFDPAFQPWTGGGQHFSFLNQPVAAQKNYEMFCRALKPLLSHDSMCTQELEKCCNAFSRVMQEKTASMWAAKLGLDTFDSALLMQLLQLMVKTSVDYTIFFRELCAIPNEVSALSRSFYITPSDDLVAQWADWLESWRSQVGQNGKIDEVAARMKRVNPKYTWREWLVVPAYRQAEKGDFTLIKELQDVLTAPYSEQSKEVENKFYRLRPPEYFDAGGISHYSCSS